MIERLYAWMMSRANHRHAMPTLALFAFLESSVFPIPPDVLLIPMVLADRTRAFRIALVCTISSVVGGMLGYAIGYFLYRTLGQFVIATYGLQHAFAQYRELFRHWGLWIILIKGLTPIPYKLITIACGVARFDFATFVAASIVTRGLRFSLEAGLLWYYGEPIRAFIERRLNLVTWLFLIGLVGGFVVIKFVF